MEKYIRYFRKTILGGNKRSAQIKKNIFFSLLIRIGSILCSFILVPLTIDFVNAVQYGIWLTISSIIAWMSFFDIGFTNGLRNKLAEAFAISNFSIAKIYVSTTYFILMGIFTFVFVIFLFFVLNFDITVLLRIDIAYESDLKLALIVLIAYFCISFVIKILSVILISDQRPARSSYIEFVSQVLILISIYIFKNSIEGSLFILSLGLCLPPLCVWTVYSIIYFTHDYKFCRPSIKSINFNCAGKLLGLGVKFFIIQVAAIVQFQTANILIARLFSMESVTEYNIAYKYFNVLNMGFVIVLQPFWSAVTNAYAQNDMQWIKNGVSKYFKVGLFVLLIGVLMFICSGWIYKIWIGNVVAVSSTLSFWMFIYFATSIFGSIFVFFVNGIGALKIQCLSSLISPVIFVTLVILFCNVFNMGMYAILIASIIANFNGLILAPLQYYKVIIKQKQGIWIK
ncbi:polysaccharide biosynthesis protein [Bacteroides sp. K03]|uniref:lipopolysaccharide biosynthesis protein n=1 Tax=Bacteroides sp. K03 TaxID=2718928 RepID=UPI001C8BEF69|nr:polysaccharide biosynthesis protein [Bacteroides sp. K03]MBX9189797.1 polysaccharide biosynthesis protein [Bacteroides sp. K03]